MGGHSGNCKVDLTRFILKVKLGRSVKLSDTAVKVRDRELRFIFDKYGDNSLIFELTNLFSGLSNQGYTKSVKGDFVHFILKKKEKVKWERLHSDQMSVLRIPSPEFCTQEGFYMANQELDFPVIKPGRGKLAFSFDSIRDYVRSAEDGLC